MRFFIVMTVLLFLAFTANSQDESQYTFKVNKSGQGNQSLILIPGFACSGDVWSETLTQFEQDFTCYTLTMPGFAGTKPSDDSTFENWKSSIADFIVDQEIQNTTIIGHSMGGGLAMAIAADYPDLIDKIVVVDALPCLAAMTNPSFGQQDNLDCSGTVDQITALTDDQFLQMQKMSMPQLMQNTEMMDEVVNWGLTSDRETYAKMFCDFSNTDLRQRIGQIECPSLVLLESPFVHFKETIEAQYAELETANLQYANKGLHFIMYDDKDWYFDQLTTFLLPSN